MAISGKVLGFMEQASWIRKMFEEGIRLKQEHGEENVFDLSLGNPVAEPPARLLEVLRQTVMGDAPGQHRYMPNAGFPDTRAAIALRVHEQHGVDPGAAGVIAIGQPRPA